MRAEISAVQAEAERLRGEVKRLEGDVNDYRDEPPLHAASPATTPHLSLRPHDAVHPHAPATKASASDGDKKEEMEWEVHRKQTWRSKTQQVGKQRWRCHPPKIASSESDTLPCTAPRSVKPPPRGRPPLHGRCLHPAVSPPLYYHSRVPNKGKVKACCTRRWR
ncbi:hypothetical protein Cni_G29271 [Canna indica]|uniref:Uncharacterized protein n=1 Tax=Canna indica TaxID=4628 RepID=A0AAQ3QPG3_9LILI|nr:hypothetical protein Cni_G29271 [Canna indica]